MARAPNKLVSPLRLLTLIVLAVVACGSSARAADPSPAMLGVIPVDQGGRVIVQDVYVGAPAHTAGLRPGDRIVAIDNKAVNTSAEMIALIAGYQPGTQIEIHASRDGWNKQLAVTLAKRGDVERLRPSLGAAAQSRPQSQPATGSQRRYVDPTRLRHIEDPYYRAKNTRW